MSGPYYAQHVHRQRKPAFDNNPRHQEKNVDNNDLHRSVLALLRWYDLCTGTSWGIFGSNDVVAGSDACKQ